MSISNTENLYTHEAQQASKAFHFAALATLLIGVGSFAIGLVNADMQLNEKGFYLVTILFGLFSVVSVQKSVRDKMEAVKISNTYYSISWIASASAIALLCVGLYHADLLLSEKGFFGIAYLLSLFAAICVQKNVRDMDVKHSPNDLISKDLIVETDSAL